MSLSQILTNPSLKNRHTDIPDIDTTASTSDDNPFGGPQVQAPGKVSVPMPTDEWLCKKLSKLNLTLIDGHLSRSQWSPQGSVHPTSKVTSQVVRTVFQPN